MSNILCFWIIIWVGSTICFLTLMKFLPATLMSRWELKPQRSWKISLGATGFVLFLIVVMLLISLSIKMTSVNFVQVVKQKPVAQKYQSLIDNQLKSINGLTHRLIGINGYLKNIQKDQKEMVLQIEKNRELIDYYDGLSYTDKRKISSLIKGRAELSKKVEIKYELIMSIVIGIVFFVLGNLVAKRIVEK